MSEIKVREIKTTCTMVLKLVERERGTRQHGGHALFFRRSELLSAVMLLLGSGTKQRG